ncbi:unnamed protein product [Brassica rapa]|uniref:F-box domain-containing protein n=1 Tax=Brassica campestris TaxID=3711 RepID=A0A3P6C844_BRACM|nr:unnamed protein product [Brassica rapa]VDD14757.1 unnamed protein product [Brassica rapa]
MGINELCDDLLVKILLQIPTEEVVATSLLSRRWRSVWKLVPKLDFRDYSYKYHATSAVPSEFIDKFLERNVAPALETLHLNLYHLRDYSPESFEKWVNVAVARNVLDLNLLYCLHCRYPIRFPTSLYTHETLVVLRLRGTIIDDVPSKTRLRSLKTLSLRDMSFSSDQTVDRFLSCFPVLETLVVRGWIASNVKTYSIRVASLRSLDVEELVGGYADPRYDHGYVIDAPRLKFLHMVDHFSGFCSLVNVPEELEAEIHLRFCDSDKLLGSLTSAKQLSLCLKPQMDSCLKGDFDQLVFLELCVMCSLDWLNVILEHSPKLRALRLSRTRHSCQNSRNVRTNWERPTCIAECLTSSLETVEWIAYEGTEEEENVVKYLLENGNLCFKKRWRKAIYGKFSYEILRLGAERG